MPSGTGHVLRTLSNIRIDIVCFYCKILFYKFYSKLYLFDTEFNYLINNEMFAL